MVRSPTIGALLPVELEWTPATPFTRDLQGRCLVFHGALRSGRRHKSEFAGNPGPATPFRWLHQFQPRIFGQPTGRGLDLFLNITETDRQTSASIDSELAFGMLVKGPLAGRERDPSA